MRNRQGLGLSILLLVVAFGLDRAQKFFHVSADCIEIGAARCIEPFGAFVPVGWQDWRGGEIVRISDIFDYVLVWNTGISYGLLGSMPAWVIGLLMLVAVAALAVWWWRTSSTLVRAALALCIGGALSNGLDRVIYGAVADFFHFHLGEWSFYIFNIADAMITIGVGLLILDVLGVGRPKSAGKAA